MTSTRRTRVNFLDWFLRVLAWDAALPVLVFLIPEGAQFFFPRRRGFMEVVSAGAPLVAFFIRLHNGRRHIDSNDCSPLIRKAQFAVFCVGLLPLVLIDCFLILSGQLGAAALFGRRDDRVGFAIAFGVYLLAMMIAMYPGRITLQPDDCARTE